MCFSCISMSVLHFLLKQSVSTEKVFRVGILRELANVTFFLFFLPANRVEPLWTEL